MISRRVSQVIKGQGSIQLAQLPQGAILHISRKLS
jgi:hypothetical protein